MKRTPIFYDTETTGTKPVKDKIIEIAAFDPRNNRTFCSFINPEVSIPEECIQISGITDAMVADAATFAKVGKDFFDFCGPDAVLIAHNNERFDKLFLEEECKRNKMTMPEFAYIDTLKWARKYRPDLPRHSLQYLIEAYGVNEKNTHRALDDVMALYKVFSYMVDDLRLEEIMELLQESPSGIRQMPFGKHRGVPLDKLPKHYLSWLKDSGALEKPENESLKSSLEKLGLLV